MTEVIYRAFVSSTFEDLKEERVEVQRALLTLNCLPIGMEYFPSTDEESWEFIKRQIEEADFYLVIVAGRYGSLAADGLSFTEKEYDHARVLKKPMLTFLHGDMGGIKADFSERDPEKLMKLQGFINKCRSGSIVKFYKNPHELGSAVLSSAINLKERLANIAPQVGYVRIRDVVDYKKYAEILEENNNLKIKLENSLSKDAVFRGYGEYIPIKISINKSDGRGGSVSIGNREISSPWHEIFRNIAGAILGG